MPAMERRLWILEKLILPWTISLEPRPKSKF